MDIFIDARRLIFLAGGFRKGAGRHVSFWGRRHRRLRQPPGEVGQSELWVLLHQHITVLESTTNTHRDTLSGLNKKKIKKILF